MSVGIVRARGEEHKGSEVRERGKRRKDESVEAQPDLVRLEDATQRRLGEDAVDGEALEAER